MTITRSLLMDILIGAGAWLLLTMLAAFMLWPAVPSSWPGWLLFVILAPPLYIAGELASNWFWSTRAARAVSQHPSRLVRITAGVAFGLAILTVAMVIAHFAGVL
jgi:hypothetical protein